MEALFTSANYRAIFFLYRDVLQDRLRVEGVLTARRAARHLGLQMDAAQLVLNKFVFQGVLTGSDPILLNQAFDVPAVPAAPSSEATSSDNEVSNKDHG